MQDTKHFIVGLRPGVDLWCASALMDFKRGDPTIHIHAFLIRPPHEYTESDKKLYFDILDIVDSTVTYGTDTGLDYKQRRARDMVEESTLVFAVEAAALPLACAKQANIPIIQYSIMDVLNMYTTNRED